MRFGLGEFAEGMTLQATGERLGLTRERVRQIEAAARAKLQLYLLGTGPDQAR